MSKYIPILFSSEMVNAILEGRKSQTRRLVKPQPPIDYDWLGTDTDRSSGEPIFYACWEGEKFHNVKFPYGNIGDILWVRERFRKLLDCKTGEFHSFDYYADMPEDFHKQYPGKWKPSIHMPKAACRIWLEITDVRVERLQDISEKDAKAEGSQTAIHSVVKTSAKNKFGTLWISINGQESWNANPFVWVIEFKRCQAPVNF